jgi:hypothetical protein
LRAFILFCCILCFFGSQAQESCVLKGEIDFPWFNHYSAYGLNDTLAEKSIALYERHYKKAKRKKEVDNELLLFALVKKHQLLFNPYVILTNCEEERIIIYMDSASYQKTEIWKYNAEDLVRNQQYLSFEAKGIWLGENAYWLNEFNQISLIRDTSRSKASSKFARDVYRK